MSYRSLCAPKEATRRDLLLYRLRELTTKSSFDIYDALAVIEEIREPQIACKYIFYLWLHEYYSLLKRNKNQGAFKVLREELAPLTNSIGLFDQLKQAVIFLIIPNSQMMEEKMKQVLQLLIQFNPFQVIGYFAEALQCHWEMEKPLILRMLIDGFKNYKEVVSEIPGLAE